jgi:hypothetical protein
VSGPGLVIGVTGSFTADNLSKSGFYSGGLSGYRGYLVLAGHHQRAEIPSVGYLVIEVIGPFRRAAREHGSV